MGTNNGALTNSTRSRSLKSGVRPGRALRWARLMFYGVFAPTFLYSFYVQIVVLKGPGRTPLPASTGWGRDSIFLTFHGNTHCTWYACLCLLHALFDLQPTRKLKRGKRTRSRLARAVEHTTHKWTAILFPLASFVGVAYYLILHFHPMTRLRAKAVPDYDEKMALLHAVPLVFVLGDALLKDEESMKRFGLEKRTAIRGICSYGFLYFMWSCLCVYMNGGYWPYPFQRNFSPIQHVAFLASVMLVATYLARLGFKLNAKLDKRRRRRLARAGEPLKSR